MKDKRANKENFSLTIEKSSELDKINKLEIIKLISSLFREKSKEIEILLRDNINVVNNKCGELID